MIKPSSGLFLGLAMGILAWTNGAIAIAIQSDRPIHSPPQDYFYTQTEILRRGDRGEAVGELQKLLKAIGLFNGPISGFYGEQTEAAVRRFQRNRGLIEDGVAGVRTRAAISAVARSRSRPSSPPPAPTYTLGSQGNAVQQIQQRWQVLGYLSTAPTGTYDETTREAVRRFQRDRGLNADGIVGGKTIVALERSLSPRQIRELQQRLKEAGFYNGAIDGVWGERTQQALEAAREVYGVSAADVLRGNY